jgi:hypothetical protein
MSINFMNGQPSADILPTKLFAQAAQKAFSAPNAANDVLQVKFYSYLNLHYLITYFVVWRRIGASCISEEFSRFSLE